MDNEWDESRLMAARDQHEDWLMQHPHVTGTAIGYDNHGHLSIKILTDHADAAVRCEIESRLQGIPICFEEIGPVEAL